jgi:hypothetical protein
VLLQAGNHERAPRARSSQERAPGWLQKYNKGYIFPLFHSGLEADTLV